MLRNILLRYRHLYIIDNRSINYRINTDIVQHIIQVNTHLVKIPSHYGCHHNELLVTRLTGANC